MMKQTENFFVAWIAVAAVYVTLCLGGCSTTAGVEATGKTAWDDQGARILEKKVVFNSFGLSWDIQIVDMKSTLVGNIMRVQAVLRSKDRDTVPFQYRFEWFDGDGLEINSGAGSWKPLILTGRETKTIQAVAPDPRAKEFKLKIREPD